MENFLSRFRKCGITPFNRNVFRDHGFSIHEKLEGSLEIENVSQEDDHTNDIVKLRTEFEPIGKNPNQNLIFCRIFVLKLKRYPR